MRTNRNKEAQHQRETFVTRATTPRSAQASFLALGVVGFVATAPIAAHAQSASEEPTRLEGVTVTDTGIQDEGYRAEAATSPKATAPILDTPRIVNVITREVLQDSASFSLQDALRTVPGITLGAGEGGTASGDIPLIRGVDATGDTFVDGARDVASQTRETFAVERVEVFKGPDSAFGGRGSAGGVINIVSRMPHQGTAFEGTATVGTDDLKRITADANVSLSDQAAFRIVGMWHDADIAGRDSVYDRRWGVAPSLTWGLGGDTRATVALYHLETDAMPDYGIPVTSRGQLPDGVRRPADVDYDNFYGLTARDFQETRADSATLTLEHDFGGGWSLSNTARYSNARNNYIVTNPDDSRGNVANGYVWRAVKSRNSKTEGFVDNLNLAGVFETGGIGHSVAIGAEYTTAKSFNRNYVVATGSGTCNAADLAAYQCAPLNAPNPDDPWTGAITPSTTPTQSKVSDIGLYAFDTITLTPKLLLNGGVRWTHFEIDGSGTSRGTPYSASNDASFWTWQGGIVFKPTETSSLYLSYADSKTPPGSDVGEGSNNLGSANGNYEPQTTENWEAGAKAELLGGAMLASAAVFRIERGNIIDNDPVAGPITVASRARLTGFEVSASGRAGPVSLSAGYTLIDSEIRDGSTAQGNALPNTPRHNLAVTASALVTPRLTIGGGAYAASERFADTANLIRADGYVRFDANASYQFDDHVELRLNVQNVGDERYVVKLRNPHFAVPSAGRQALMTLSVRY